MPGPRPRKGPQARGQGVAAAKQVCKKPSPLSQGGGSSTAWANWAVCVVSPLVQTWSSASLETLCLSSARHVWEMRPELSCASTQASSYHGHLLRRDLEDSGATSL